MYRYYNAHPKGLSVGDCVKRAITVAAQMDYMEVQRELNRYKKVTGATAYNSDYNPHKYVENVLHGVKLSFPAEKGKPRMNGQRFCESYKKGRYILNMAGHWSCCVDGVIYDTWDCSDKCVYTAYKVVPMGAPKDLKNCCTFELRSSSVGIVRIYDGNGTHVERKIDPKLTDGYIKCLEDNGYSFIEF
jgi:hypothetical protein